MFGSLIQGILLGWGVAVPIGPLNVLIMTYAFKDYKRALTIGIGAMATDMFYLTLLSFGVLQFLDKPMIMKFIAIFGASYLSYMAFGLIKDAKKEIVVKEVDIKPESYTKIFIKGCLLNLANPYVILFWLSMTAVMTANQGYFLITLVGLVVGILSWITVFPLIVYKNRNALSEKFKITVSYLSALILLFFAIRLLYVYFIKGVL
ncbi:MAG: LysE family transporter [Campylobacteraceae bacterium]|nr:LysE family transporter [Campylobacteraceae bacterium]